MAPEHPSVGITLANHMRHLVIAATMLVCGAATAAAQFPPAVRPGARVRVWLPEADQQQNGPWRRQLLRCENADDERSCTLGSYQARLKQL